jgi:sterol desaturase/sphingolipid hydroxylase (fatty acid hydroxylase superfamily)
LLGKYGPWSDKRYQLDKMSLGELALAFFTHYSIQAYILLFAVSLAIAVAWSDGWARPLLAAGLMVVLYPLVEYLLHRFVLHGELLYKHASTAKLWKRIHYDHHQNPHDLKVLFGALYTTLPTIALITLPIGALVGGIGSAAAAFAMGCVIISVYEFCHCVQHLPWAPRSRWLRGIKRRHLAHHFHSERGNFGITSNLWDRVFGTFYEQAKDVRRSETTYNLGYTGEVAQRYPWVAELSESEETYARQRRRRAA